MIATCRSCGSGTSTRSSRSGSAPLANRLRRSRSGKVPTSVIRWICASAPTCSLAQLADTVPPSVLFRTIRTSLRSRTRWSQHARGLANTLIQRPTRSTVTTLVLEIGSNDGYLLQHFAAAGIPVLGVDPAEAACELAAERRHRTRRHFSAAPWPTTSLAKAVRPSDRREQRDGPRPRRERRGGGRRRLLGAGGVFVIETPYLRDLVERLEFDTIYHEHVFYYSLTALAALLARHGLTAIDVARIPIHGGSLRVTASSGGERSAAAEQLLKEEAEWGVRDLGDLRTVHGARRRAAQRAHGSSASPASRAGRRLAAYGAAAKGVMLLNALDVGQDVLDFVVDRNPEEAGPASPGLGLADSPARASARADA